MDIRVVIADDEPLARQLLERLVGAQPGLSIVGVAHSGHAAERLIAATKPDLVFLDIEMPEMTGVELTASLRASQASPLVIFITAFDRFATEAFDLDVLDYLVKPIAKERFSRAIERARKAICSRRAREPDEQATSVASPSVGRSIHGAPSVTIRQRDELIRVPENDIYWLEAASQYVNVHTRNGSFLVAEPLKKYFARLAGPFFRRVHRSAVVNVNVVRRISRRPNGVHELQLANGAVVPLSRSRRALLPELLDASVENRIDV